jgi:hypothetical protein
VLHANQPTGQLHVPPLRHLCQFFLGRTDRGRRTRAIEVIAKMKIMKPMETSPSHSLRAQGAVATRFATQLVGTTSNRRGRKEGGRGKFLNISALNETSRY